jgi:hypothetical protein
MPATLVDHNAFPFADGDLGHTVNLGSAPQAGDIDVIMVVSVTVIESVSGFGTAVDNHLDQDHVQTYQRDCTGSEGSTFVVNTNGNFNTVVFWQRWRGLDALDKHALNVGSTLSNSVSSGSSGTLAAAGEVAVVFAGCTATFGANQAGSWGSSYTELDETHQGSSTLGVYGASGYKVGVGTAAESSTYTWTGDAPSNNTGAILTFTVSSAETVAVGGTTPAPGGSLGVGNTPTVALAGATPAPGGALSAGPPGSAALAGSTPAPGGHLNVYAPSASGPTQASSDLAGWFTQTVTIERLVGRTGRGTSYAAPTTTAAFVDQGAKLVRNPQGDQVVSSARVFLPATTDAVPLGSRVTLPAAYGGVQASVLGVALHLAPGLPVPEHLEVQLT